MSTLDKEFYSQITASDYVVTILSVIFVIFLILMNKKFIWIGFALSIINLVLMIFLAIRLSSEYGGFFKSYHTWLNMFMPGGPYLMTYYYMKK
jgi:hypothetical protein